MAEPKRKTGRKKTSATTRSTAGPGFAFEDQVAAWLLLKMLLGEAVPGMENSSGTRLQTQTSALGWLIDDLLVISGMEPSELRQLAISCKSNVQVTSSGLPRDFVLAAWQQWSTLTTGPMRREHDRLMLVTRGRHPGFQASWTDIKDWCTSTDPGLAIARIRRTAKHRKIFESIKSPQEEFGAAIRDEDVVELIQHLLVVPLDFDLSVSEDQERAIAQCRRLLASGAPDEARDLWNALVDRARKARLGDGTIELAHLWRELRMRFMLNEHPNFASSWRLLKFLTNEYVGNIQLAFRTAFHLCVHKMPRDSLSWSPIILLLFFTGIQAVANQRWSSQPWINISPIRRRCGLVRMR